MLRKLSRAATLGLSPVRALHDSYMAHLHKWPHKVIFIAGMPKSGTTWLEQLLGEIPAYRVREVHDPCGCVINHDVCDAVFAGLPWNLYSVVKLHTRYTTENLQVIDKFNLHTIVMFRDLRDQCISRYYHVLNEAAHRHHKYYVSSPQLEGISHCIEVVLEHYVPWIRDWLPIIAAHPDRFMEVRYETLRADPRSVLADVLAFYGINEPMESIDAMIAGVKKKTTFNLRKNLNRGSGTARKGVIGDWRNHFTPEHVKRFKEGCGEFLIQLGYEKDLNWGVSHAGE
ncbi:MAG: sulfotransferase domain-containing protein [Thermodesulfobacteriota bacterium]